MMRKKDGECLRCAQAVLWCSQPYLITQSIMLIALACAMLIVAASSAQGATVVALEDKNSTAEIALDPNLGDPNSVAGQFSWVVDGVEQIYQQWFWYRIGDVGPEAPLDEIGLQASVTLDRDGEPGDEKVLALYDNTDVRVVLSFSLAGGEIGSNASDILEIIEITNLTGSSMDLSFFQYVDFDLGGDPNDKSVEIIGGNTAIQEDFSLRISETAVVPTPTHYEVAVLPTIIAKLTDGDADNLDDVAGPVTNGDLAWAFQWDLTLSSNQTALIAKNKTLNSVIPAPSAIGGGLALMLGVMKRRRGMN